MENVLECGVVFGGQSRGDDGIQEGLSCVGRAFYTDGGDIHVCVEVFIDLCAQRWCARRETENIWTDDLGEVNNSGLVFTSQPFFHAVLLPFEQIFELFVAWKGRVVEGRSDVVRHDNLQERTEKRKWVTWLIQKSGALAKIYSVLYIL